MFLSKFLTLLCSCTMKHYILIKNIFVVIAWNLLPLYKYYRDMLMVNDKQTIKIAKRWKTVKFKNYMRKIKLPFMINVHFKKILVPEKNGKQNSVEC